MTAFAAKNAEKRSLSVSRTRKLSETERARLQGLLDRENSKGAITVARLQATNKKAAQAPRPRSAADRKPSNSGRAASARGKSSSTPLPGFRGNNRLGRSSGSSTPHSGPDYAHPRDDKFEIVDLVRSRPSTASSHYGTRAFQDTLRSAGTSPSAFDGTSRLKPGVLANPATPLDGHDQGSAQVVSQTRVQEGLFPTGAGNDPHVHWQGNQSGPTRSKTHPRPGVSLSPRTTGAATPVRTATDSQGQQTTPRSSSAHAPRSVAPSATKQSTRTGVGNEQASGPRLGPTQAWAAQVPEPTPSQVDKNNNEAPAPKQGVVAPDVEAKAGTLQGGCVPAEEEGEGDVRVLSLPVFRVLGNKVTLEELLRDKVLQRAQGFKAAQLLQLQLRTLDAEGTGSIPADRLAAFLDMWQVALTDRQLAAVCDQYDDDGSGELSIDLFVRGVLTEAFGSNPGLAGRPVSAGTGASSQRGGSGRTPQHPRSGKKLLRSAGTTGFQDGLYTESMAGVDVGGSVTAASSGVSSGTSTAATAPIPVLVPMRKQRYLPPSAELLPAELAFRDYLARECGAMGSGGGNRAAGARPPTPRSSATPATATPTATTPRGRGGESGVALGENRGMLVSRGGGAQLTYEAAYECFKRLASSLGISLTGNTASNNSVTHSQLRALFRRAALDVADTDMEDLLRRHDASWRGRIHVAPLLHALVRKGDNGEGEDARERAAAVLRQLQEYLHSECIGLRAAFNMLDRAGSGMVGPSGVHALCTLLGVRGADEDVVRAILSLLDGDGDGSVSFHDFVVRMKAVEREMVDGLGRSMGDEMRELHQQQRREMEERLRLNTPPVVKLSPAELEHQIRERLEQRALGTASAMWHRLMHGVGATSKPGGGRRPTITQEELRALLRSFNIKLDDASFRALVLKYAAQPGSSIRTSVADPSTSSGGAQVTGPPSRGAETSNRSPASSLLIDTRKLLGAFCPDLWAEASGNNPQAHGRGLRMVPEARAPTMPFAGARTAGAVSTAAAHPVGSNSVGAPASTVMLEEGIQAVLAALRKVELRQQAAARTRSGPIPSPSPSAAPAAGAAWEPSGYLSLDRILRVCQRCGIHTNMQQLRAIAGECSTEPGGGPGVNYHELLASLRNVLRVQATSTSSARHSTAPNEAQGTTTSITRPDRGAVPGVLDALTGPKEPVKVRETQVPSRLTVSQLESLVASKLGQRGRPGMAGMLRLAFQWFDRDVEGRIPHDAFRQQLARLNIALDDDTWQAVLRKYDPRDSGYVNFHQFMSAVLPSSDMASIMSARATSYTMDNEGFRRALQGMDRDNSGSLPQATVWQALVDKGYSVPHGIFTQLCTKCRMDAPVPGGAPGGPLYQPPRVDYIHFCELLQEAERVQLGLQGVGFVNRSKPAKSAEGDKAAKRPPLLAWVGAEDVQAGISTELGEQKRGGKRQGIANTPPLPMAMMETRVVPKLRKAMQDHRPELAVATAEAPAGRALRELDANVDARHALAHNDDRQHGGNSWGTPYNERPGTNVHPTYSLGSTQVLRVHDD
eukprot:jgi/Mesvir1/8189/Mv12485-RA.1